MKSQGRQLIEAMDPMDYIAPSSSLDNFQAGVGWTFDTSLAISRWVNEGPLRQVESNIVDSLVDGIITEDELDANMMTTDQGPKLDSDTVIGIINQRTGQTLQNATEARENIYEDLKMRREYYEKVSARATTMGHVTRFVGSFITENIDPWQLPSYFVGVGPLAHGVSWIRRASIGALKVGTAEGALDLLKQPMVGSWKREVGIDYSVRDAVISVASVTIGSAMLAGAGPTIGHFWKSLRRYKNKNMNLLKENPEGGSIIKEMDRQIELGKQQTDQSEPALLVYEREAKARNEMESYSKNVPEEEVKPKAEAKADEGDAPKSEEEAKVEGESKEKIKSEEAKAEAEYMKTMGDQETIFMDEYGNPREGTLKDIDSAAVKVDARIQDIIDNCGGV